MKKPAAKLIIIDANALIHRAFHALPPLTDQRGRITNAVYGFTNIFLKTIKELKPDYLAAAFDLKAKTIRHQQYQAYKATRQKQPDELYEQIPLVKQVLEAFDVPIFELAGYEADDLIGTISQNKKLTEQNIEVVIVTGDQDVFQLIRPGIKALLPHRGLSETILYDEEAVIKKFDGLKPKQLIDYKALRGDPSDNIPGVKGIGDKGAIELLKNFGSLENIYQNLSSPKIKDRTQTLLQEHQLEATMSKKLATIITDAPIELDLEKCRFRQLDKQKIFSVFQDLNFKSLLNQINKLELKLEITSGQTALFDNLPPKTAKEKYLLINDSAGWDKFISLATKQKELCLDTETTGLRPFEAELVGVSFAWKAGQAFYLPTKIIAKNKKVFQKLLADKKIKKIGHNLKYDIEILERTGIITKNISFDTMIASYLLNPGQHQHNLDSLAFAELGRQMQPIEELIGRGKNKKSMAEVDLDAVCQYACEDADFTWRLYQKLAPELVKQGQTGLFHKLEMPLLTVLARMEKNGVKINDRLLKKLSADFGKQLSQTEKKIQALAGTKFNPASPKQLKEVLFEKMKISTDGVGRTKTGLSTAAGELEKLKGRHKIIDLIGEFRELSKLKSTYLDALPKLINPHDGRIHTSFNQTVTATGRLSSSEPNLQNIPIRTETGGLIRQAFVAAKGFKILIADYSQIELRIAASLANDKKMLKIFTNGGDIHTETAAFIHGLKPEEVTKEIRRTAKEVNFGVLYGMGAWGLAQRTGISNSEAQEFIAKYFSTFKDVRKWLNETIAIAKDQGYVETLYGRRRYLPEINSGIQQVRAAAERMAINMPVQGTAADLIKLAMIEIDAGLPKISPHAKMILQVHDELVFEAPEKDVKKVAVFIKDKMCSVMKLRAPIEVDVSVGDNWGETEKIDI
ncbi:MAG TPA: DNA polymerase I [bacterium]|mgnify:CR=1 FL=1|nr:DNA polymerase I [bacterium]HNS34094.1 DNA polymerase I [bacterium]HNZ73597.1 DNA polymerase I [bacterium]HOH67211.1 DNA polymerase I [bacterium]HQA63736.1 DNA polymerase I [bacterium]